VPPSEARPCPGCAVKREGRGRSPDLHTTVAVAPATTTDQSLARDRVAAIDRQCWNARAADRLMPMAVHYGPRPLRAVPLAEVLAGRWTA